MRHITLLNIILFSVFGQDFNFTQEVDLTTEKTPTRLPIKITKKGTTSTFAPSTKRREIGFQTDCSDPYNRNIGCNVDVVDCDAKVLDDVETGLEGAEAHDLRINSISKVGRKGKSVLHVSVSWQSSPSESSKAIQAFKLKIKSKKTKDSRCFIFNVTQSEWDLLPRFHFSSDTMFHFDQDYDVSVHTYPQSSKTRPMVSRTVTMPDDPDLPITNATDIADYCKNNVNLHASKWAAGFRRIYLLGLSHTIHIEFVAAPASYCFEQYELRLLDESGLELLHSAIVNAKDLKKELIEGKPVWFGEYNFTNLELNTGYIPSVIPVETAEDGRCLCPTLNHESCSCIAADWKVVRLNGIDRSTQAPPELKVDPSKRDKGDGHGVWLFYGFIVFIVSAFFVILILSGVLFCYSKYKKLEKMIGMQVSNMKNPYSCLPARIGNKKFTILIVYAHDCKEHEDVVVSLAELLRDCFDIEVHIDVFDKDEIEKNLAEYLNSSVIRSDRVLIINSVGSYQRVMARHLRHPAVDRASCGILDNIFLRQIDFALQHQRLISVRFNYTPTRFTLFTLNNLLQYNVPDNLSALLALLSEHVDKMDPRLERFETCNEKLNTAIKRMNDYIAMEPQWFEITHRRKLIDPELMSMTTPLISTAGTTMNEMEDGLLADTPVVPFTSTMGTTMNEMEDGLLADTPVVPFTSTMGTTMNEMEDGLLADTPVVPITSTMGTTMNEMEDVLLADTPAVPFTSTMGTTINEMGDGLLADTPVVPFTSTMGTTINKMEDGLLADTPVVPFTSIMGTTMNEMEDGLLADTPVVPFTSTMGTTINEMEDGLLADTPVVPFTSTMGTTINEMEDGLLADDHLIPMKKTMINEIKDDLPNDNHVAPTTGPTFNEVENHTISSNNILNHNLDDATEENDSISTRSLIEQEDQTEDLDSPLDSAYYSGDIHPVNLANTTNVLTETMKLLERDHHMDSGIHDDDRICY